MFKKEYGYRLQNGMARRHLSVYLYIRIRILSVLFVSFNPVKAMRRATFHPHPISMYVLQTSNNLADLVVP